MSILLPGFPATTGAEPGRRELPDSKGVGLQVARGVLGTDLKGKPRGMEGGWPLPELCNWPLRRG